MENTATPRWDDVSLGAAATNPHRGSAPRIVSILPPRTTHRPPKFAWRHRLRCFCRFLCRLDVCWTFFFFLFLVCVAAITTAITQTKISRALLENLHDIHNLHITTIFRKTDLGTDRVFNMAAGFLALHSQSAFQLRSEETLSALCAILATYDPVGSFRSLAVTSLQLKEAISCIHGDANLGSKSQLYGWYTEDSVISGVYLINNETYDFIRPLQPVYGGWPTSEYNLSTTFENLAFNTAIFRQAAAYFNGSIAYIDYRTMWRSFTTIPHILYCTIPAGFLFRGLNLPSNINVTDYVDVRVDGSTILAQLGTEALTNITAAIFINASLHETDPLIMSNNWGQASVNDSEILSTDDVGLVTYLPVSNVSDPLMRAALKHVNFAALQQEGHNETVDFQYRGAPATVTATTLTTDRGLILPMVFVSSHTAIAMPYRRIMDICNGVTAVVILLFTALFWYFIKSQLHDPLADIASLLLQSVKRGTRALFRTKHKHCVTLTEVQQLATAHNNAMRQLREIDTFIPEAVRHLLPTMQNRAKSNSISVFSPLSGDGIGGASPRTPSKLLLSLTSTVVYITISRVASTAVADRQTVLSTSMEGLPQRHRLAAIAASAARSVPMVNCGPFPSSAAVSAFVEKLHELCVLHHGTVHRLTPDSCILHFCKGVQDHMMEESLSSLFGGVAANAAAAQHSRRVTEGLVKKDARSAALFSLQLQAWWDRCKTWHLPDIRLLLDTSTFTFGHYRPSGCEQMIPMALGRDVQREVGAVPAIIGVRIAMTEETASCLRAGATNDATGEIEPGVRQLPVEALRTGRVGLDADVVVLFEVLPGPVLEDEAWQQYQQCCFDGFSFMVHGDYAAALRTFKDVMDISDLEPGLMPTSLRREAAATSVTGGAVSVQVERLMRECVQHILKRCTEGFHRRRQCPLGIDAVLGVSTAAVSTQQFERSANRSWSRPASTAAHPKPTDSINALRVRYPTAPDRQVVELRVDKATLLRTVIATSFHWVEDNCGLVWQVVPRPYPCTSRAMWETRCRCLGSAGAIAILNFVAFCDVARPVANAIRDAPLGPMSDALRSAASVFGPTSQQEADLRALHAKCMELQHPNLLTPLGYSTSVEGGAALLWEYSSGGTLREVAKRYANIHCGTITNFLHCVLEGLVYLHSLGIAHGAVHLDNILVGADGICRLHGHCTSLKLARRVFVVPQTCYVSPAMAAGALPTPACDMFCYGLLCIELLSGAKAWRWAVSDQGEPGGTDDELATLMAAAEQPFFDAVAAGRIVANIEALNHLAPTDDISKSGFAAWKDCLSLTASKRPSSLQLRTVTELYLSKVAR